MANTYSQIHIHTVFAVQNRQSLIQKEWQEDLYQYITGIVKGNQHKMLQINGMPDHIHLLIGMRPHQALSDLMKVVKGNLRNGSIKSKCRSIDFPGNQDMELFLMLNPKCQKLSSIFKISSNTIKKRVLQKNTLIF